MLVQEIVNAILQLAVVLVLVGIFWGLFGRRKQGFLKYTGLYAPTGRSLWIAFGLFFICTALSAVFYILPVLREAAAADNTVAGAIRRNGWSAETVGVIFVVAGVKTALTEEIFFRGLIAKRLISWLGFSVGNLIHALIFGAVHLLVFLIPGGPKFTPLLGAAFLLLPGASGWLMAFANEKAGNGSIAPGWMIHALGNAAAYPILAFLV
jgi:membrane protease YdiL (CAAX protease family)